LFHTDEHVQVFPYVFWNIRRAVKLIKPMLGYVKINNNITKNMADIKNISLSSYAARPMRFHFTSNADNIVTRLPCLIH
jgi:hypothetical protein